jgi:hypothetical protein
MFESIHSSSLFGSFVENGPIRVQDNGTMTVNPNSWHQMANMLYSELFTIIDRVQLFHESFNLRLIWGYRFRVVEQPVGTGFSFTTGSLPTNEFQVW